MRFPLFLSCCLAAAYLCAQTQTPVTADELCRYTVCQTLYGTSPMRYNPEASVGDCHFTKTNDTLVVLNNFMGSFDMPFVLKNDTLTPAWDPSADYPAMELPDRQGKVFLFFIGYNPNGALYYGTDKYAEGYSTSGYSYTYPGSISRIDDSRIQVTFGSRADHYALCCAVGDESAAPHFYGYQTLDCFTANATMASMLADGTTTDNIPVRVDIEDGDIAVYNWDDIGWTWTTGTTQTGGIAYGVRGPLSGSFDAATRAVSIPHQQYNASMAFPEDFKYAGYGILIAGGGQRDWFVWPQANLPRVHPNYIGGADNGAITGSMAPRHWRASTCDNWAVDCGGNLRTDSLNVFTFGPWQRTLVTFPQGTYNGTPKDNVADVSATVISQTVADVTLQASLTVDDYGPTNIAGSISATNDWNVESYDLYAVAGNVVSIEGRALSTTTGFSGDVHKLNKTPLDKGAFSLADMSFWVYDETLATQRFTLYLKANYRSRASGSQVLNPTFHSLRPLSLATTAIDDVAADASETADAFYDLQGRRLSATPEHGVWIERRGTAVTKVAR